MRKKLQKLSLRVKRFRRVRLEIRIRKAKKAARHPHAVPFITVATLLIICAVGYLLTHKTSNLPPVQYAKIVIISHDGEQQIVPSREATVGALLAKLHLVLNTGDVVEPAASAPIDQDKFRINIYRAKPVEIVDGSNVSFTFSAATTPRAIAQQAGVNLYPQDDVSTQPVQNFTQSGAIGQQVVVNRATPVNVDLFGTQVVLRTHATTVAGLIASAGIKTLKTDQIVPGPNTPITPNEQISFIRTGIKVETDTQTIAMPIQVIDDNSLAYGTSAIRQQGAPGQEIVTYQVSLENNVETGRTAIQTVIIKPPVTQIEVEGTSLSGIKGDMALAGIAPGDYQYADYIISNESGWCPTKAQGQYGGCPPYAGYVPSYGGYGLCQATPGGKMVSAGSDWATNPITQLRWCAGYANGRYGSWYNAYIHWVNYHNW